MASLYSYTIPIDDGAAPNPFGGMCTLAICKPVIRRTAEKSDWIVGLGSRQAPSGDLSGRVVYAMRVDEKISLQEYDQRANDEWPHRVPKYSDGDPRNYLGDCIYDYSEGDHPRQRIGVHGPENVNIDLGGENALISHQFYYFGRNAIALPDSLRPIIHQTQGHKKQANDRYVEDFVEWIRGLGYKPCHIYGVPDKVRKPGDKCKTCKKRKKDGQNDKEC